MANRCPYTAVFSVQMRSATPCQQPQMFSEVVRCVTVRSKSAGCQPSSLCMSSTAHANVRLAAAFHFIFSALMGAYSRFLERYFRTDHD